MDLRLGRVSANLVKVPRWSELCHLRLSLAKAAWSLTRSMCLVPADSASTSSNPSWKCNTNHYRHWKQALQAATTSIRSDSSSQCYSNRCKHCKQQLRPHALPALAATQEQLRFQLHVWTQQINVQISVMRTPPSPSLPRPSLHQAI